MESIDSILGEPAEVIVEVDQEQDEAVANLDDAEQDTGEARQVAADKEVDPDTGAKVKSELAALAKERERIRQKEAALDEERAKLATGTPQATTDAEPEAGTDLETKLDDLMDRYDEALIDGDVALRRQLRKEINQVQRDIMRSERQAEEVHERSANDFNAVFEAVHKEYPFLSVDHPQVNPDLNDDINTYFIGRLQKGDSQAVALRKAVDKYAPAYAGTLQPPDSKRDTKKETASVNSAVLDKLNRSGFSEVRSVGRSQATKPFTGVTPLEDILGKPK